MKKTIRTIARAAMLLVCISMIASCLVACPTPPEGPNYDHLVKLTIDAGGQNAQYNSTTSMDYMHLQSSSSDSEIKCSRFFWLL